MIFSRLSTNLISQPFDHEDPNLELIQAPEGELGYASRSSGAIRHVEASLHCLFNNEDLAFDGDLYYMQSIGQEIELSDCPATLGEHGEGTGDGSSAVITPLCACEQSLYWAQQAGYACAEEELIYFYHPDYLGSVEFITDMRGEPYQFFLNTPWGENLENQFAKNYTSFSSRFRFNGKEWDEETGNYYYGARYYDPKVSVWLSVDPMASERSWVSPYNFVQNNPLNRVDPTGALDNPIYSKEGEFLGTDEKGLEGDAIIMDENDFEQGMSHEDAMDKGNTLDNMSMSDATAFANNGNFKKFLNHYNNLPNRIDYSSDFVLTKEIADKHWQGGTGEGLFVNQANIDLPGVTTASFDNKDGSSFYKNFVWGMSNTGKVYGTLKLTLQNANSGTVHIGGSKFLDEYDFSMDGRPLRDFATWWGRPGGANDGKSYFIYGYGKATVPVKK